MLDSYFFIPGDKTKYLEKIDSLTADYIVIDLEDSVAQNNKQVGFEMVRSLTFKKNFFLRIPFFDSCYSKVQIQELITQFEGQIVLPKINSSKDVRKVVEWAEGKPLHMIVLIENPRSFIATKKILKKYSTQIHAIGFGTHDFCSLTGIKHSLDYLAHYKRELIVLCKAYQVDYLDGVDLNLQDLSTFKTECLFAFEAGATGKFLIHPKQLEAFHQIDYLTPAEIQQLQKVYTQVKDIPKDAIEVYTIDGTVYEKPHILRIKKLMEKIQHSNTNLNTNAYGSQ
ncbi:aldolase/citrate lyase family protein [Flavobacterium sp.]|uniref:HpcH/HpaI aldolase/citrate lyase family protein n=1 Tax=Flavobacterium sp. TaxID=239 RepID=UPI00333FF298